MISSANEFGADAEELARQPTIRRFLEEAEPAGLIKAVPNALLSELERGTRMGWHGNRESTGTSIGI
jgi:hypothetical protein